MRINPLFMRPKFLKSLTWLSLTLISFAMKAQAVKTNMTSSFYTAYCYLQTDNLTTYNFVATDDVGGTPTTINFAGNNNGSVEIALPANFDFTFYCEKISKLRIGVDGLTVNLAATNVTGSGSWATTSAGLSFGTAAKFDNNGNRGDPLSRSAFDGYFLRH